MTEEGETMGQTDYALMDRTQVHMHEDDAVTLDSLAAGQSGHIARIRHAGAVTRRIMDMGLVRGVKVTVVKLAPLGDPMEIKAKGYNLSLRRSEAATILVKREPHT
jgi:ferrous iron transport protein A